MTSSLLNVIVNPVSILTRPTGTSSYAQNNLIASSATAGSIVVPSFNCGSGPVSITRFRLTSDITTGWGAAVLTISLWLAPPTYTNGDHAAYAVATGSANLLGTWNVTLVQYADGAGGATASFQPLQIMPLTGVIFWDLQLESSSSLTPISLQTFTLTAECAA